MSHKGYHYNYATCTAMSTNRETNARNSSSEAKRFKILFAGDPECGKTRAIQTYLKKGAPKSVTHTSIDTTYEFDLDIDSNVTISLVDVRGTYNIATVAKSFDSTNVAIFFYAINNRRSLENLRHSWVPRFRSSSGFGVPTILVGNKTDLRAPKGQRTIPLLLPDSVPFFHGMQTKTCCSMDMFLECSAEDEESVYCLFQAAYSYVI